jgi:hypothetical protein
MSIFCKGLFRKLAMKKNLIILGAAVLALSLANTGFAGPTDYFQYAIEDAMVDSDSNTTNYGSSTTLSIQGFAEGVGSLGSEQISYLKFDLSSIPDNAQIISATFGVYYYQRNPGGFGSAVPEVTLYYVSDDSWDEDTITYNTQPSSSSISDPFSPTVQLTTSNDDQYITWNLLGPAASGVYSWQSNYTPDLTDNFISLLMQPLEFDTNNYGRFYSTNNEIYRPYLAISYTVVPAPGAVVLGCIGLGVVHFMRRRRIL